jgi:formylglycine-generating enzyme required for sulfatase activity/dienelactone hydrolase
VDVAVGQIIADRYRVAGLIGEGGMGVVYRATDEQLRRTIAIKILPLASAADADRLRRFKSEIRALSALNHPHIVSIYEIGQAGETPFFVMELVEGQTLRERLGAGPLPLREALDVTSQLARGLSAAHDKGLVHRDIKPGNVMIRPDGYVKVLDFGIALLRAPADDASITTTALLETMPGRIVGTPAYMAPEQIDGGIVDARTDIFALGTLLCEALTGKNPFARSTLIDVAAAMQQATSSAEPLLADLPADVRAIVLKSLQRDRAARYASATELAADLRQALANCEERERPRAPIRSALRGRVAVGMIAVVAAAAAGGWWMYRKAERRHWVHEQAVPEIARLVDNHQTVRAFALLRTAEEILPRDPEVVGAELKAVRIASVVSSPPGATVQVQDYASPDTDWLTIGATPLNHVRLPAGYLKWKVSKAGVGESITAPLPADTQTFDLQRLATAPAGMVPVNGTVWGGILAFLGALGPIKLPPYFIDRYEVTNREYQKFVDAGGYTNSAFWTQPFADGARTLTWSDAINRFRDVTGRPGPASWTAGHYPDGKADFPVTGVSWFEAAAYAQFAGKSLPVIAQGYNVEPTEADQFVLPLSNMSVGLAPAGRFRGLGPYGTYDMIGNAREWYWNADVTGLRYTLGRQPGSYGPEALPPFDRSALNGFRCVTNTAPLSEDASAARPLFHRNFAATAPANDQVFRLYRNMYAYDRSPLEAMVDPQRSSTEDWTREKVTLRTAYGNQRMAVYLFLPKRSRPPFQTVVFFPSARVNFEPSSADLGDLSFMDYVVQSGRAVVYPVYESLYERRTDVPTIPGPTVARQLIIDWSKDLGRSIDYLETRPDIDHDHLGYLGVSQGSAYGVILVALEPRLKTAIFLDGGYFQFEHPIAGLDQVDFAPRLTQPVLMVNGRYDATFPYETAQLPMFRMLGTPAADKRHVVFDTPHDVRLKRPDMVREVLGWLDNYLGRVP